MISLSAFGDGFGGLLVPAECPFGKVFSATIDGSTEGLRSSGAPEQAICEAFGRAPGLPGVIGERIGLPPDWTDQGA